MSAPAVDATALAQAKASGPGESFRKLLKGVDLRGIARALDKQYNFSRFLRLDADGIREYLYNLFNNHNMDFIEKIAEAQLFAPRFKTLQIDMEATLIRAQKEAEKRGPSTVPLASAASSSSSAPSAGAGAASYTSSGTKKMYNSLFHGLWGKYMHPHSKMIQDHDERLFTEGLLEIVPFLNQSQFEHQKDDVRYLARIFQMRKRGVKIDKLVKEPYWTQDQLNGADDDEDDEDAADKPVEHWASVYEVSLDNLRATPHNLEEAWDDGKKIAGFVEHVWSGLNNLDSFYMFIRHAKDEYLMDMRAEIIVGLKEASEGGKEADIYSIVTKHIAVVKARVKEEDMALMNTLVQGAIKQNDKTIIAAVPSLVQKAAPSVVSNFQDAFHKKTGRKLDRDAVSSHLQDAIRSYTLQKDPSLLDTAAQMMESVTETAPPMPAHELQELQASMRMQEQPQVHQPAPLPGAPMPYGAPPQQAYAPFLPMASPTPSALAHPVGYSPYGAPPPGTWNAGGYYGASAGTPMPLHASASAAANANGISNSGVYANSAIPPPPPAAMPQTGPFYTMPR
jgi:hypothetical protein